MHYKLYDISLTTVETEFSKLYTFIFPSILFYAFIYLYIFFIATLQLWLLTNCVAVAIFSFYLLIHLHFNFFLYTYVCFVCFQKVIKIKYKKRHSTNWWSYQQVLFRTLALRTVAVSKYIYFICTMHLCCNTTYI